jgi:hypothetical protein
MFSVKILALLFSFITIFEQTNESEKLNAKNSMSVPGGYSPNQNLGDNGEAITEYVIGIANWACEQLNLDSNHRYSIIKITDLKTQIVEGTNYMFNLILQFENKVSLLFNFNF